MHKQLACCYEGSEGLGPFSIRSYLHFMCQQGTWGDAVVLIGVSKIWNVRIAVIDTPGLNVLRIRHNTPLILCDFILVQHTVNDHYSSTDALLGVDTQGRLLKKHCKVNRHIQKSPSVKGCSCCSNTVTSVSVVADAEDENDMEVDFDEAIAAPRTCTATNTENPVLVSTGTDAVHIHYTDQSTIANVTVVDRATDMSDKTHVTPFADTTPIEAMIDITNQSATVFQCESCGSQFHSMSAKKAHMRIYHTFIPFDLRACAFCSKIFKSPGNKRDHEKYSCPLNENKQSMFKCTETHCYYKARTMVAMMKHKRDVHSG